jgi:hypothetical protein
MEHSMFIVRLRVFACLAALVLACLQPLMAQETTPSDNNGLIRRDASYEQYLRIRASDDNTITPARVINWLDSLFGSDTAYKPARTEFQPVVDANNSQVRVVARWAYKF